MNQYEFIKYEATPGEKHLGIATVKLYGKLILRYKIVPKKDGNGFYPTSSSLKIDDRYVSSFTLDSLSEKEEIEGIVMSQVRKAMGKNSVAPINELPF